MLKIDETILKTVFGFDAKISFSKNQKSRTLHSFDFIANTDGSIRWIWPSENKEPLFLKLYVATNKTSKIISRLLCVLFYLPILKRIYIKKIYVSVSDSLYIEQHLENVNSQYVIFTGTVGPNRKIVVYQQDGINSSFLKLPFGKTANNSMMSELRNSNLFQEWNKLFHMPAVTMKDGVLKSTDLKIGNTRQTELLFDTQMKLTKVIDGSIYKGEIERILSDRIKNSTKSQIPSLNALEELLIRFYNTNKNEASYFSVNHGDFTSWNCAQEGGEVKMYDFEFSSNKLPIYYDVFHFWVQQFVMCTNKSYQEILLLIEEKWRGSVFAAHAYNLGLSYEKMLVMYLYYLGMHYYKVYTLQCNVHHQGVRLINFLVEALRGQVEVEHETLRSYHIENITELLKKTSHCILKEFGLIKDIATSNSDIDLVIEANQVDGFISNLSTKGILKKIIKKKSFMQTIELYFTDNTFLSIDIITEFKQKWHHYLEAHTVLCNTDVRSDGLNYASLRINIEYVILFYVLNGASIPEKYVQIIKGVDTKEFNDLQKYIRLKYDLDLSRLLEKSPVYISKIIEKVKKYSSRISNNKNVINYFNYLKDTIRSLNFDYSRVITFSGVDGAGKTTVINYTKELLEKKYRKKVVVLRHRPSLMPILSAYVYGKEKASQRSMASLPRQGGNKSVISSLLRFTYYLTDYFLGQFYVFFRFTLFNYIVIYDRYYFDFILDGKRSNISLDSRIPKMFFKFIMKPKLNVFLYADPEVILKRKQELTEIDIIQLTKKYKELFFDLASKGSSKFLSVENMDLKKTMDVITRNVVTNI